MALQEKISQDSLFLYEIMRNPVLFSEFINNIDLTDKDTPFELTGYQKEYMLDFSEYEELCCSRAVGKCLDSESKLLNSKTGEYKTVKQWFNETIYKIPILSIDKNWKQKETLARIEYNGIKDCIKIETSKGFKTTVTPEHPILTNTGFKDAQELKIGDYIAIPNKIIFEGSSNLVEPEIKLLAHFIAEGTHHSGSITTTELEVISDLYESCEYFDTHIKKRETSYYLIKNKGLKNNYLQFLERLNLKNCHSYNKFIPQEVFKLNKTHLALFLNRLFSDDGWCDKEVGYGTTSEVLARDIQHLLLRFGIVSSLGYKTNKYLGSWSISIKGKNNIISFKENIGFVVERKQKKLLKLYEDCLNFHNQADVFPIPNYKKYFIWCKNTNRKNKHKEHLFYFPSREKASRVSNKDDAFFKFENADIFWVKVESLELLKDRETYSIESDKYNTLIADNIYSHNTLSISNMLTWSLTYNVFPGEYITYFVPGKAQLDPVWTNLIRLFRSNSFLKNFIAPNQGINSSDFKMTLLSQATLMCRIAGQSGNGANVIGLHTPYIFVDECLPYNSKVKTRTGSIFVSRLKVGDKICSWDGTKEVLDTVIDIRSHIDNTELLNIQTDSKNLVCTGNHRIYNGNSYMEAKDLNIGDTIYLSKINDKKYWSKLEETKLLNLVKNSNSAIEIAKILDRTELSIFRKVDSLGLTFRDLREPEMNTELQQIIRGSLLGDGSCSAYKYRANYNTNHSYKQKDYVEYLYNKLHSICKTQPRVSKNGGWGSYNYGFSSLSTKKIKSIYDELYKNGIKNVTKSYLDTLDVQALAIWFCDDGSYDGTLSTHGFSKQENILISEYFKDKWTLNTEVKECIKSDKTLYYIRFVKNSRIKFFNLIADYVPECMKYKIGIGTYNNEIPELPNKLEQAEIFIEDNNTLKKETITNISTVHGRKNRRVYTIETEINHNYFANNILVKNCGYFPWNVFIEMQPILNTFTPGHKFMVSGVPNGLREKNVLYHCDQENSHYSKHRTNSFSNPRFTKRDLDFSKEQYGGEDNEDFIHYVLGKHGKPVFALFDRTMMEIGNYATYKLVIDGPELAGDMARYYSKIHMFPGITDKKIQYFIGIDLGYTEPTAIVIMYIDPYGRLKFHGRIQLNKVSYTIQERIIDELDTKFEPFIIGIDYGGVGRPVVNNLKERDEYAHKNYAKKMIDVDFSSNIILGIDSNGEEIKEKTKPFSTSILQDYSNNHKIVYTSTDLELVTELERMTYTKTPTGEIVYRTLTTHGGKKGADHFTSALLCATLAYYTNSEYMLYKHKKKKLLGFTWL